MDRPTVYIETTVVSYLAARPSRDPVTARKQAVTREWWSRRGGYRLFTSESVIDEARCGDPVIAGERLRLLAEAEVLEEGVRAAGLAAAMMKAAGLPATAGVDALHIATAAVSRLAYLLTWNCRHIANPALTGRLEHCCRLRGYDLPALCTPEHLIGG